MDDCSLSTSAALAPGMVTSDIINPLESSPIEGQSACTVIAPTATEAEVLSTAFLAMGRRRASAMIESFAGVRAFWIDRDGAGWLDGAGGDS
jgi:thiamine biosynthesis lipoprotein